MKKIKKLLKKQGFTLVELIIVIAIIAVLAVAAFMMLTKWLGKSRDSRRLGDLGTIKKALEVTYSDTDRGLNMYPDPTDSVEILDGSGVVMWNQGVFGLETISNMDNMQKAPQDPGDQSYYRYAVTLDKKEFQLGTVLEDGSDVSMIGSVLAANGEARLDGNYDGYVSYPTTGGTMIFKTPSLLVKGEAKIEVFSGEVSNLMLNGESEGAKIELRSVKTDGNTSPEAVATALGIDEKSAVIVLKKETGTVVVESEVIPEPEPSLDCERTATTCESTSQTSCENIKTLGFSEGDGEYWIDSDGEGTTSVPTKVYCDMSGTGVTFDGTNQEVSIVINGRKDNNCIDQDGWFISQLNAYDNLSNCSYSRITQVYCGSFDNIVGETSIWRTTCKSLNKTTTRSCTYAPTDMYRVYYDCDIGY